MQTGWYYEKVQDSLMKCGHPTWGRKLLPTKEDWKMKECGDQAIYHIITPTQVMKYYCKRHAYADTLIPAIEKGTRILNWYRLINRDDCDHCQADELAGKFYSPCLQYIAAYEFGC
tara:strand:+ start:78 stop:425 length:348 start_codon:yes stop_codon:yes gene_type:complete